MSYAWPERDEKAKRTKEYVTKEAETEPDIKQLAPRI